MRTIVINGFGLVLWFILSYYTMGLVPKFVPGVQDDFTLWVTLSMFVALLVVWFLAGLVHALTEL